MDMRNVDYLYHYSSFDKVLSILKNKEFWLSEYDSKKMNDCVEVSYYFDQFEEFCKDLNSFTNEEKNKFYSNHLEEKNIVRNFADKYKANIKSIFKKRRGSFATKQLFEVNQSNLFIQCFSLIEDNGEGSRALWDSYAKEGCCLKINKEQLHKFYRLDCTTMFLLLKKGYDPMFSEEVCYHSDDNFLKYPWSKKQVDMNYHFQRLLKKIKETREKCSNHSLILSHFILEQAAYVKHHWFLNEQEYRIAFNVIREDINDLKNFKIEREHRNLFLRIQNIPLNKIIDEIIISTYCNLKKAEKIKNIVSKFGIKISNSILTRFVR